MAFFTPGQNGYGPPTMSLLPYTHAPTPSYSFHHDHRTPIFTSTLLSSLSNFQRITPRLLYFVPFVPPNQFEAKKQEEYTHSI